MGSPIYGDYAFKPHTDDAVSAPVSNTTGRLPIPPASDVMLISVSSDTWIKFGDLNVDAAPTAGNCLLLAGTYTVNWPYRGKATHIAFIRNTADGSICLTPLL